MLVQRTAPNGATKTVDLTEHQVAGLCLELCGGGYTEAQTAEAIEFQRQLLDGKAVQRGQAIWEVLDHG